MIYLIYLINKFVLYRFEKERKRGGERERERRKSFRQNNFHWEKHKITKMSKTDGGKGVGKKKKKKKTRKTNFKSFIMCILTRL